MGNCSWRQKVRWRRSRWRRLAFLYAKLPTSEKALCPESDASVKSIDAVLGEVRLPGFWPSKSKCPRWTSITPLPQDRLSTLAPLTAQRVFTLFVPQQPVRTDLHCANFRLRCDTIDERGGSTQRHDDVDKCADDLRHEMALEIWIVSVHEKSEQL